MPRSLVLSIESLISGNRPAVKEAASELSQRYRSDRPIRSDSLYIRTDEEALAYLAVRMPATYAATAAVFSHIAQADEDFEPRSMLDIGAGPGTASFAAAAHWPRLNSFRLIDRDERMSTLGQELAARSVSPLMVGEWSIGNLDHETFRWGAKADLVTASYVLGEVRPASRKSFVEQAWECASGLLAFIEPGTMSGYERILDARRHLIEKGAHILAPCPHCSACPLAQTGAWCHFVTRLDRSRLHRQIKNASRSFEDEPYAYVVATKTSTREPPIARVINRPHVTKGYTTVTLCASDGLETATILRRNRRGYKAASSLSWGDGLGPSELDSLGIDAS